jgi:hypothetical protein
MQERIRRCGPRRANGRGQGARGSAGVGRAQATARGRQQSQATAHGGVGARRQYQGTAPGLDGGEWQRTGGTGARCGWRERCTDVWKAWSKRVSGTRTKRRWGKARSVAARICWMRATPSEQWRAGRVRAQQVRDPGGGEQPGVSSDARSGPGARVRQQACAAAAQEWFVGDAERVAQACAWWHVGVGGMGRC